MWTIRSRVGCDTHSHRAMGGASLLFSFPQACAPPWQMSKAAAAAKLKREQEARKKAIAFKEAERRRKSPALAKKAREEALKKEKRERELKIAAARMAALKSNYRGRVASTNKQFQLNKKIQKNAEAGRTTRI